MDYEKTQESLLKLAEVVNGLTPAQQTIFFSYLLGAIVGMEKEYVIHEALNEAKKW